MTGKTLLHYQITGTLGHGGMGVVYKATDTVLEREVALKFLSTGLTAGEADRERLKTEARAAAALNHPNIATIHAIESVTGPDQEEEIFLVMEYINGSELSAYIAERQPAAEEIIDIAAQIVTGLAAAHQAGVVHRDIKSSNIMITADGRVKIMDFGLARIGETSTPDGQTETTAGTVSYMSPEQVRGETVGTASDIWSLGVVLYELICRELPFKAAYEQAVMYAILNEETPSINDKNDQIPQWLETIVLRCLQKDAAYRYPSAGAILEEMNTRPDEKALIKPESNLLKLKWPGQVFEKSARRIPQVIIISVLFTIVFVWQVVVPLWQEWRLPERKHLLVLPFSNIGNDPGRQAFCDGLVETMTSKLSQLGQFHGSLWVIPASEIIGSNIKSPSQARDNFGVNLVVTGSIQAMDEALRVTLNLVDTEEMRQLNSTVIDVQRAGLATLQDQSVTRLMEMLQLQLDPQAEQVLTADKTSEPGAYEFYLQGRGYLQRYEDGHNIETATDLFRKAIVEDSSYALAYAALAEAYWLNYERTKNTVYVNRAREAGRKARQLSANLPAVNIALGMIHSGSGAYDKAIADFKQALANDPGNADAHRGLAKAYELTDKPEMAEATYKNAINLKPDYWAGYNDLGAFYFRNSQYEKAIEPFKQVLALTPDNYRGYNNLGGIYYMLKRWDEARLMFEKSLKLKESYSVASNLGTLYYIEGAYTEAARMYRKALKINDHDYVVWGNLGSALYWSPGTNRDAAIRIYEKAIARAEEKHSINPNDAMLLAHLAGYYAMTRDNERAFSLLGRAQDMAPDNAEIMYRTACTYEQLGYREQAIKWIEEAVDHGYSASEIRHQPELRQLLKDDRLPKHLVELF